MKRQEGFTLIELLVVVAIVGIIAAVALPAYTDYVLRSKLTEPMTQLASMRVKLEQYYQDTRNYGSTGPTNPPTWNCTGTTAPTGKYFTYSCSWRVSNPPFTAAYATDGGNQSFTVTATGMPATPTAGFVYTIDQLNNKQTTAVPSGWTASSTCWITKKGGVC